MSLNFPSSQQEIIDRIRSDSQSIFPNLNPTSLGIDSFITGFAGLSFEQFLTLQILLVELFLDTTTTIEFLSRWGSYKSITQNPASQSQGFITATGTDGSIISDTLQLTSADGILYDVLNTETVLDQSLSVTSVTRVGSTATATTVSDHNLASGVSVTISGAVETEYNGTFDIIVTGLDEFTYQITGTPTTPATGTILSDFTTASVEVKSVETGEELNVNQANGVALTFTTTVAGVDNTAFVQFGEIGGGSPAESVEDFRERILQAYQDPFSLFNVASIVKQARTVPGVTRVFVEEATPDAGQVTIFFTRDNDADIIPSASEVTTVKNSILEIKPAGVPDSDVIVSAPTPVVINFTFTSITPSTPTMQTAITNSLDQFFREKTFVGVDVMAVDYESEIINTIDTETGQKVTDFSLSSPVGNISIASGQIGVLGTVNF